MTTRVCLDLFAGLGGFSAAFEDSDAWEVVTVDIEERFDPGLQADVMDLRPADLLDAIGYDRGEIDVFVILASPPCILFSFAGNHDEWDHEEKVPVGERAMEHTALVHHTIGLIKALSPDYWFMENPNGRMQWVIGKPTGIVTYCQYGKDYFKQTFLWGEHPPMEYKSCSHMDDCHKHLHRGVDRGRSATAGMPDTHADRAKVPYDLSLAIRDAVEDAESGPTLEQSSLPFEPTATDGGK